MRKAKKHPHNPNNSVEGLQPSSLNNEGTVNLFEHKQKISKRKEFISDYFANIQDNSIVPPPIIDRVRAFYVDILEEIAYRQMRAICNVRDIYYYLTGEDNDRFLIKTDLLNKKNMLKYINKMHWDSSCLFETMRDHPVSEDGFIERIAEFDEIWEEFEIMTSKNQNEK